LPQKIDPRTALQEARREWPVGTRLQHYKGGIYIVTGHGFDTERQEANIHYERRGTHVGVFDALDEEGIGYDRPISLFTPGRFTEIK
jgi:hypothetical protein